MGGLKKNGGLIIGISMYVHVKTNELITDFVSYKTQLTIVTKPFQGRHVYSRAKGNSTTELFNTVYCERLFMIIFTSKCL